MRYYGTPKDKNEKKDLNFLDLQPRDTAKMFLSLYGLSDNPEAVYKLSLLLAEYWRGGHKTAKEELTAEKDED